jgi:hypothetical protein
MNQDLEAVEVLNANSAYIASDSSNDYLKKGYFFSDTDEDNELREYGMNGVINTWDCYSLKLTSVEINGVRMGQGD